jgi:hypothetical protein
MTWSSLFGSPAQARDAGFARREACSIVSSSVGMQVAHMPRACAAHHVTLREHSQIRTESRMIAAMNELVARGVGGALIIALAIAYFARGSIIRLTADERGDDIGRLRHRRRTGRSHRGHDPGG